MSDDLAVEADLQSVPEEYADETGDLPVGSLSEIYLAALGTPVLRREDLEARGFNEADISTTMPLLEARGMVRRMDRRSWEILPPEVVLPAYATRLEDQARSLRASSRSLSRLFHQGQERHQGRDPFHGVTVLTSLDEVSQAVRQVVGTARETVTMVLSDSPYVRSLLAAPDEPGRGVVNNAGKSVRMQLNYSDTLLAHPRFPDLLHACAARGEEQRITARMSLTCIVNDVGLLLIDLEDDDGGAHGLLVTDGVFSSAIVQVCQWAWPLGVPWNEDAEHPLEWDPRDVTILRLMAAGTADAAIGRHLKISQRTVERRVRMMMDRLNATTRFQAGFLAAQRKLL